MPFRDFFDPGFVLTEFASAAVQWMLGDNLVGEMLLTSACIGSGAVCILLLVHRMTASTPLAVAASVIALLTSPRPYDYDKFLFYPLGLLIAWRYAETRRTTDLWIVAAVAVVAGMFRYDNGVFIAIVALVVIASTHVRERYLLFGRAAVFIGACVVCALPYLVFLQMTGGVDAAIEQAVTYAVREGAHTRLTSPPRVLAVSGGWSLTAADAAAVIFYLFLAFPLAALITISGNAEATAPDRARVWSVAIMTWLVAAAILREPIAARIGGAIAPAAVLAAWLWHRSSHFRWIRTAVAIVIVLTLARATEWPSTIMTFQRNVRDVGPVLADATASPPPVSLAGAQHLHGVIAFLRRCTQPQDRILTTWFAPEVYFLSGRAFAGGIAATFGGHWSEPEYQRRIVATLAAQSVPIVLFRDGDESFPQQYPIVAEYLRASYQTAGVSAFGPAGGERFLMLIRNGRPAAGTDAETSMPCFASR